VVYVPKKKVEHEEKKAPTMKSAVAFKDLSIASIALD
jgi:hypothetical protein